LEKETLAILGIIDQLKKNWTGLCSKWHRRNAKKACRERVGHLTEWTGVWGEALRNILVGNLSVWASWWSSFIVGKTFIRNS